VQGVDTLYHESTYLDNDREKAVLRYHSTTAQAAEIANKAGVKQLLLGHFSSKYKELAAFKEEAVKTFFNVYVTEEGKTYEI
jgi:ribonuclease Z